MNKLHIALLSVLFSAPVFCSEAPVVETPIVEAPAIETPVVEVNQPCRFAHAYKYATAPFVFALTTAPDKVANFIKLNKVLKSIASVNVLGGAEGRLAQATPTIGRVIVLAAATALAYKAYVVYAAEEAVDADEDFFSDND